MYFTMNNVLKCLTAIKFYNLFILLNSNPKLSADVTSACHMGLTKNISFKISGIFQ